MKRFRSIIPVFIFACFICAVLYGGKEDKASAAGGQYISEVRTALEDEGKTALAESGFVLFTPSLVDGKGQNVWIGYKTTTVENLAVTDIRIKKTAGNIEFETKKEKGRAGIAALGIISADTNSVKKFDDVYPLSNNGIVPVTDPSGKVVTCDTVNGPCYVALVKSDVWKNYVAEVTAVKESSKKAAIIKLAELGCEYYIDSDLSAKKSECIYLGYTKTADDKTAVTDIISLSRKDLEIEGYEIVGDTKINGRYMYVSHDQAYGNPICDIEFIAGFDSIDVSAKQWTDMVIACGANISAKPYIMESDDYQKMIASNDEYTIKSIYSDEDEDMGLVITALKKGLEDKENRKKELIKELIEGAGPAPEDDTEDEEDIGGTEAGSEEGGDTTEYDNASEEDGTGEYVVESGEPLEDKETEDEVLPGGEPDDMTTGEGESAEGSEDEDTQSTGTILVRGHRIPRVVEIIIFAFVALMIPVATYFIKKKFDVKNK